MFCYFFYAFLINNINFNEKGIIFSQAMISSEMRRAWIFIKKSSDLYAYALYIFSFFLALFNGNWGVHRQHKKKIYGFFAYTHNIGKISVNWIFAGEHAQITFILYIQARKLRGSQRCKFFPFFFFSPLSSRLNILYCG